MTNWAAMVVLATNMVSANIDTNAMSMWNFVAEAKNLTRDEKEYYNASANSAEMLRNCGVGSGVRIVAEEVKALDKIRDILKEVQSSTNVQWVGSVVVQLYTKVGDGSWDSEGPIRGRFANPEYEIGFRGDGVVVWRKKP